MLVNDDLLVYMQGHPEIFDRQTGSFDEDLGSQYYYSISRFKLKEVQLTFLLYTSPFDP